MNDSLPQDPYMLLSIVNMKLRDQYADLDDLCASMDIDKDHLERKLKEAGFVYDPDTRSFR